MAAWSLGILAITLTVTITAPSGPAQTGVVVIEDDFYITFRDASGTVRVVKKAPGVKIVTTDGLQAHRELLDRISDKNIHDLVAYLESGRCPIVVEGAQ